MMADVPFDPRLAARKLLHKARTGALATLIDGTGDPYCSLVNVATDPTGAPLLLLSMLALHTKNLLADGRVSLMLDERKEGDPLAGARVMLMGTAAAIGGGTAARSAYLRRHPDAEMFAGFADFGFYRMEITRAHLVAGFGRIVDLKPAEVLSNVSDAATLVAAEAEAVTHMNTDHADALRLYATKLLGAPAGDWRCVGINPDGMELQQGRTALWVHFPRRVMTPASLRQVLRELAERARAD